MRETEWKSKLKKEFESIGAKVLSLHGHAMQAPGWPDLYVCHPIWSGWIELKMHDGELSTAQKIVGNSLECQRLAVVLVADEEERHCFVRSFSNERVDTVAAPILHARQILERIQSWI